MKKFKKIVAFFLAFAMVFTTFSEYGFVSKANAAENITLRFHFQKSDGNYGALGIYAWKTGAAGTHYAFTSEDEYGKIATVSVSNTTTSINYLVTDKSWNKDYASDRVARWDAISAGYVDIYLVSGVSSSSVFTSTDGKTPVELISACIAGEDKVEAICTGSEENPDKERYVLKDYTHDEPVVVPLKSVTFTGTKATFTTEDKLDFTHVYRVFKLTEDKSANSSYALAKFDFNSDFFNDAYKYDGDDLGLTFTDTTTTFKVWAPTASNVEILVFADGQTTTIDETIPMTGGSVPEKGVWTAVSEDKSLIGKYYLYKVYFGESYNIAMDPYARTGDTSNDTPSEKDFYAGQRGMIINPDTIKPEGWDNDKHIFSNPTDAIIYETSVRDFSSDIDSGVPANHRMKYLAFTDKGTKNSKGTSTCMDYLVSLGITHVQIMPSYDFYGTNETSMGGYNWGYNPVNYNIPEGAFSTNPKDGTVRVLEYKQMIQALHNNNIGAVMDVVYNHVNNANSFSFEKIVPGYFFTGSNGSGCGNDVASERAMVSKYIVDSVIYWEEQYHFDGFRFDLLGLLDVDTMNKLREELDKINPGVMLYGEGWNLATSSTRPDALQATQANTEKMDRVGMFSDAIRNGVGGATYGGVSKGYATGNPTSGYSDVKDGVKGKTYYTSNPSLQINYVSCHDNYTFWDKICKVNTGVSLQTKKDMNKLSAGIIMMSQGTPLFLSGEEFLRTKGGDENSYKSPDSVNLMDWSLVDDNADVVDYYRGLISFRKAHKALRLSSSEEVSAAFKYETAPDKVIAYSLDGTKASDISDKIYVVINPYSVSKSVTLPAGDWKVCINGEEAGTDPIERVSGTYKAAPYSINVMVQGKVNYSDKTEIFDATADISYTKVTVSGKENTPKVTNVKLGDKTLTQGTDYEVLYKDNVNVGTGKVIIKGIGNYVGRIEKTFAINKISISKAKVSGIKNVTFAGKSVSQNVVVKDGSKTLKKGVDYKVTYSSNTKVGTATVIITGINNYSGTIKKTFKITLAKPSLTVKALTKSAKVSWKKVPGASSYKIYMSTRSSSGYKAVATVSSSKLTYTKKKLTKGKKYYFKIVAVSGKTTSSYSAVKYVKSK